MDLDSMRYAVTLADELHFGRSAAKHFISEPQFGRRIRKFESQVGAPIFERTSRRVRITAQGYDVLDRARAIIAAIDALRSELAADTSSRDDVVRVGVLGFGVGRRWRRLREIALSIAPDVEIVHRPLGLDDQHSALLRDEVDVAVVHYLGEVDGLDQQLVMDTDRVAVVPVGSPLTERDHLDLDELADFPWLRMAGSDERFNDWVGPCTARRGAPTVTTLDSVVMAVATTELLGLHGAPAATFYPHPDVRFVPIADMSPVSIALATRSGDQRGAIEAFRTAARLVADPNPVS